MFLKPAAVVLAIILALPVMARAQSATDMVSQATDTARCKRPDRTLIRKETAQGVSWTFQTNAPSRYNEQARDFNDCTRLFIINANGEINRIRGAAMARYEAMAADANKQIRAIEAEINDTIATASGKPVPEGPASAVFPAPECKAPDDGERDAYNLCIKTWIGQAEDDIRQIAADTKVAMDIDAGDTNRQIREIKATILTAVADMRMAVREQAIALDQLKASLAPVVVPEPVPGVENVLVTGQKPLPRSADTPTGAGDPDAISCRTPQIRADSRLLGPGICKRNREWAIIFKRGEDIAPDGFTVVSSEKERTFNPNNCRSLYSYNGMPSFTTSCVHGP
jgi:hypothetical protein